MLLWIGFSLSVVLLLLVARRNLALGMAIASVVLALFTLSPMEFLGALETTITDPSVLLLAFIVSVIPMIGGVMETTGEMDRLVSNLRIGVRPFLGLAPAILGMLPMPGGALLSAPLIERGAGHTDPDVKAAANVWFRHVLLLVYPLGSGLIASAKMANLSVYDAIPYLLPAFALCSVTGYLFLLRRANGTLAQSGAFSLAGLLIPLSIILAAPFLDLLLSSVFRLSISEISTAVGVTSSLALAMAVGRVRFRGLRPIFVKMRPWKYALIILAMFVFLNVFTTSGVPERIAVMALPPVLLCVVIGALLGLITGRIQAPMSILVPIFVTTYGAMSAPAFALTYFAVFLGYAVTPIHPCISVSLEYFKTSMGPFLRRMALPTAIGLAAALIAGLLLF